MAEAAALFEALKVLTEQVKMMAERTHGGGGEKRWDHLERYKNLKLVDGRLSDFEEWSVKLRSLVCAGQSEGRTVGEGG